MLLSLGASASLSLSVSATADTTPPEYHSDVSDQTVALFGGRPPECPPCFNCNLKEFQCHQFSHCDKSRGQCDCTPGWGGQDCTTPLCGSLADGKNRPPRQGKECECRDGWGGINCNVCQRHDVCNAMVSGGEGGVCYEGGLVVNENFQQCDVTNKQIVDQLKGRKPQVTFSCNNGTGECNFQCE